MTKIKIMSVRDEDIPYIEEWAEQNNVEVELNKEILTEDNVDDVQGFDGLSLSQQHPISEDVFAKLQFGKYIFKRINCVKVKGHITVLLRYNVFNDKTYPGGLHDPSTFYTEKRRDSKHY